MNGFSAQVIMNEQHTLLPEQKKMLDTLSYPVDGLNPEDCYETMYISGYEIAFVPAEGWNLKEQSDMALQLASFDTPVVFVSPVPILLAKLAAQTYRRCPVYVFHNDQREKKELPGGRVISVTAATGWQLVKI